MSKIKWLLQDVSINMSQLYKKHDALMIMKEPFANIGVMKEHNYITGLSEAIEEDLSTIYVFLSGVKVLNILNSAKHISDIIEFPTPFQNENSSVILKSLVNGIFYNITNFDQKKYSKLNLPLLNNNAEYLPLKDNLSTSFLTDKFIKPSRDLKAFDAGILKAGDTLEKFVFGRNRQRFFLDEYVVVANVIEMKDEYRFFIVNKEVVGCSAYRVNGIVGVSEIIPDDVMTAAINYALLYQPADIFTMDLARLNDDTISIIEYNCFNCSGVYSCYLLSTYSKIKSYLLNKFIFL